MPKIENTSPVSVRKRQKTSWIDNLERVSYIVDKYLRWVIQVVVIICLFSFLEEKTAQDASLCVLGSGSARKLIELYSSIKKQKD